MVANGEGENEGADETRSEDGPADAEAGQTPRSDDAPKKPYAPPKVSKLRDARRVSEDEEKRKPGGPEEA